MSDTAISTFFIDESGHGGDLALSPDGRDFAAQPVFVSGHGGDLALSPDGRDFAAQPVFVLACRVG